MNRRREHWIRRKNHKRVTVGILVLLLALSLPGTTISARAAEPEAEDSDWSFTGDDGADPESERCEGDPDIASETDSYFTYEEVKTVYGDPVPENPLVLSDALSKEPEERIFFASDSEHVASVDPASGAVSVHHAGRAQITAYERPDADAADLEVRAEIGESVETLIPVNSSGDQIEEEGDAQTAEGVHVLASYVLTVDKRPLSVQFEVEKTVGEPDPDLETRIRETIAGQLVEPEEETETTLSRLCGEISYEYSYEGDLTPPGLLREVGESPVILFFSADEDYVMQPLEGDYLEDDVVRERRLVLTTHARIPAEEPSTDPVAEPSEPVDPTAEGQPTPQPTPDHVPEETEPVVIPSEDATQTEAVVPVIEIPQSGEERPGVWPMEPSEKETHTEEARLESERVLRETVISGVEDQRSYTGAVTPTIQIAGDGYDSYQIRVTRESFGEEADVTAEVLGSDATEGRVSQGADAVIYGSNLEPTPENDGVYTLSVQYQDAHGNEVEKKITYTVNRFGSVYVYQPYVKSLAGAWVQKIKRPLLITEYNPDPIQENSLHIAITRDGEPIDHVLYSVSQGMQQTEEEGHKGWYRYDYAIARENFREDGHYRIVISSKDTAGNQPENANDPTGEIAFQVDATPPEIQELTGFEKPYTDQAIQPVTYRIYDSMQLASVRVYVNDAVAQEVTEFEDPNYFRGELTLCEGKRQRVYLEVTDLAGNQTVSQTYELCWHRGWLWCLGFVGLLAVIGVAFGIFFRKQNLKKKTSAA